MSFDPLTAIFNVGSQLIDKLIPDPTAKAKAQLDLVTLQQSGELKNLEIQMSAIVMEAQSADKWTSRARPSFLYIMYILILMAIPMGVLSIVSPEMSIKYTTGMQAWWASIPEPLYALFGIGYLGYTGARTWDKTKLLSK